MAQFVQHGSAASAPASDLLPIVSELSSGTMADQPRERFTLEWTRSTLRCQVSGLRTHKSRKQRLRFRRKQCQTNTDAALLYQLQQLNVDFVEQPTKMDLEFNVGRGAQQIEQTILHQLSELSL